MRRMCPGVRAAWPRTSAGGTVHTAQCKESDVVLFTLGWNLAKPGAKQ